ncbi:hypothetical protein ABVT39_015655 [Epinephelus coioides]
MLLPEIDPPRLAEHSLCCIRVEEAVLSMPRALAKTRGFVRNRRLAEYKHHSTSEFSSSGVKGGL